MMLIARMINFRLIKSLTDFVLIDMVIFSKAKFDFITKQEKKLFDSDCKKAQVKLVLYFLSESSDSVIHHQLYQS